MDASNNTMSSVQDMPTITDKRLELLTLWLNNNLTVIDQIKPLSGDASFRRYFRVSADGKQYVVMDAPPTKESCVAFVAISETFRALGLCTPKIYAQDIEQGFLLLSDFGDQLYLDELNNSTATDLYHRAFDSLLLIQSCAGINTYELPSFNAAHYRDEMSWFKNWYVEAQLGLQFTAKEAELFEALSEQVISNLLSQPVVCVHRDFHSRNLMLLDDGTVGILDFQDALWGPITYDLLSLLRDCYIDWPQDQVRAWVHDYYNLLLQQNRLQGVDFESFMQWFDWVGLQRNLKCIGNFARLNKRDNKPGYLVDIPRVINYAREVCQRYDEFSEFGKIMEKRFLFN